MLNWLFSFSSSPFNKHGSFDSSVCITLRACFNVGICQENLWNLKLSMIFRQRLSAVYSSVLCNHYSKHFRRVNVIFPSKNFQILFGLGTIIVNNKMSMAEFSLLVLLLLLILVWRNLTHCPSAKISIILDLPLGDLDSKSCLALCLRLTNPPQNSLFYFSTSNDILLCCIWIQNSCIFPILQTLTKDSCK